MSLTKPETSQRKTHAAQRVFLTSAQVRGRYGGISSMALWRWLHDPRMDFPRPVRFGRLRFWELNRLEDWERNRTESEWCR